MSEVTVVLVWHRGGVPDKPGDYLIELEDGEHSMEHYSEQGWTRSWLKIFAWARIPSVRGN